MEKWKKDNKEAKAEDPALKLTFPMNNKTIQLCPHSKPKMEKVQVTKDSFILE